MKDRLAEVVDEVVITGQNTGEKMCSCESDVVDETCSSESYDACGDCGVATKKGYVEILEFTHFFEHFTFDKTDWSERGKHRKKYVRVVGAVELVAVGAKIEPTS